jgi:hypothetical protein
LLLKTSIRHDPLLGDLDAVDYVEEDINDRRGSDMPHRPHSEDTNAKASDGLFDDDVQLRARGTYARASHPRREYAVDDAYARFGSWYLIHVYWKAERSSR